MEYFSSSVFKIAILDFVFGFSVLSGAGLGYFRGEKWKNKAKIYNSGGSCSVSLFRIFSIRVGICLGPKENPITICKINYSSQIISDLTSNNFFFGTW